MVSVFLRAALETSIEQEIDGDLRLRAASIQDRILPGDPQLLRASDLAADLFELAPVEEFSAPGIYVKILDRNANTLAISPNLPGGYLPVSSPMIVAALAGAESFQTLPFGEHRVRVLAEPIVRDDNVVGVVLVGESMSQLLATLRIMHYLLAVVAAGAVVASIAGGWWLTTRALDPVVEVTSVAKWIANTGQFTRRIDLPPADDELRALAATFNQMIDRLERAFRHQQEFLANASHELRGPLAVIRGNLDLLKLELPPSERQECVREAGEEVERMSRLVSDLLFLAEVEAAETLEHSPVDLHRVVQAVCERARTLDAGEHQFGLARNDDVTVIGDRDRLDQMIWNLVENALRYTPLRGRVTVELRCHRQVAEVVVADTGVGIPADSLPHVFERFYRVDKARSRRDKGTGLGLAIVRQIAEAHGGQVRARSQVGEGSVFTVVLPTHIAGEAIERTGQIPTPSAST